VAHLDKLADFQRDHRFPDGRAADAELFGQIAFGRQPGSRLMRALPDAALDFKRDALTQFQPFCHADGMSQGMAGRFAAEEFARLEFIVVREDGVGFFRVAHIFLDAEICARMAV
jgi:hypothetical protein